ncbi:protein EMBRYONIC FLOWER 1 isoform X2 [Apium graveolens]|uniref:protein EMBRYONIC FLOWER 1 isoform X2 n=1 Tax=Apium graveolens TaxID=4045 RepID=UPI003D78D97D
MEKDRIEEKNNHTGANSIVTPVSKSVAALIKIDSISIDLGKSMDNRVTDKCHHFSMRQYCTDMRTKDVRICAPFSRIDDDETKLRKQLAPLCVPKFRWWCCQSCVQDASASSSSSSQSQQNVEKTSPSSVIGPENGMEDFSRQQICDQTLTLMNPAKHVDDQVGEISIGRELANVCVPEPASNVAATDVLAIEYPGFKSSSSSEKCLAEKADTIDEDPMNVVLANGTSNKDTEIDASTSTKDPGAVKKASSTRRKKKVRLIAEILHVNDEKRSDQLASNNATPNEHTAPALISAPRKRKSNQEPEILHVNAEKKSDQLASYNATPNERTAPASISAPRKRKIIQEPFKEMQPPTRKPKKVRAIKGDAITTIATIHNSDSESVEDDASAGTGFKNHMPLQKTGNEPCLSKLKTKLCHGDNKQGSYKSMDRGNSKEDIGLDLSLNSYMDVDKIKNLVPNKKTTLINNHRMKEGSRTGPSSVPNFSFSKDIEEDMSGRIAYSTDITRQEENSVSLRKKLELSLGCSNNKAAEPKRFSEARRNNTDQRSDTVFEQRSYDDIPMEIVELMAKHQYERGLSEAERNSCLTKRIDERNYEMMGLSDVNGSGMQAQQKEHNKWNPINLSQASSNHYVVGNRDESHVLPMFGTCSQKKQKESVSAQIPQTSASRTFINNTTQNFLWSGDRLVHRSSPAYTQVIDTCKTTNNGPQHSGMAGNIWASGASSIIPSNPKFPQTIASGTSNMASYLPYPDLHKGKTIRDLDLNRSDPNDSDVEVLSGPVVADNKDRYVNPKELNSIHPFSNEAIPAMQLLSLMDAGTPSHSPFTISAKKVLERPFFPCNNHTSIGMVERANLFEKPLFPQSHQVKEYSGPGPSVYKSTASTTRMPSAYYGPNIVTSRQPEKANKIFIPQQNKDWMVRTPVGANGVSDIISGCNLHQGKQKGIISASVDVVFPMLPKALKITENHKDVGSCQMHGTIRPLRDISKEEVCNVNRNPADFTIPEAGNMYMIHGGDLKFNKDYLVSRVGGYDGITRHGLKLIAPNRQAVGRGPTVFP